MLIIWLLLTVFCFIFTSMLWPLKSSKFVHVQMPSHEIPRIPRPHHRKNNGSKDMQPLRSTSSLHLTRVQAKESSQSLWKARSWRFGSRYVRPRSLSTRNGEVAVVLLSLPWNEQLAPENGWLEYDRFLLGMAYFQRRTVSFRGCIPASAVGIWGNQKIQIRWETDHDIQ